MYNYESLLAALVATPGEGENREVLDPATGEQGKPLNGPNARFEVGGREVWTQTAADTPLPVEVLIDDESGYPKMHYRPIGVVGTISPWNCPMVISIWQIAPSLRMGNTIVIKPAETTSLSVLALVKVMNEVLPEGVLNILAGPGSTVGDALTRSPRIGKIMFTGSTPVGKQIIQASAPNITRLTLELGGNPDYEAPGNFYLTTIVTEIDPHTSSCSRSSSDRRCPSSATPISTRRFASPTSSR